MVVKSKGPRHKSRKKMIAKSRPKPSQFLQEFNVGDNVHFKIQSNLKNKGYPYIKFHGSTGEVVGKRGNSYLIKIHDKNKAKTLILNPVHLKIKKK